MTRARRENAPTTPADPAERAREIALRVLTNSPRSSAQLREKLIARAERILVSADIMDRWQPRFDRTWSKLR